MHVHEARPLFLGHLLTPGQGLEVVLTWAAGSEHQQHRCLASAAEAVDAAFGDVEEVT